MKTCHKCKREFPATPEYFYRDKKARDGLRSSCKICSKKGEIEQYNAGFTSREERAKRAWSIDHLQQHPTLNRPLYYWEYEE